MSCENCNAAIAAERAAHAKTLAHVSHLEHILVGEGYTSEHAAHAVARLVAERDAALRERDAVTAELEKAISWLDRYSWARSTIDLDAGPLEVQLATAIAKVAALEKELAERKGKEWARAVNESGLTSIARYVKEEKARIVAEKSGALFDDLLWCVDEAGVAFTVDAEEVEEVMDRIAALEKEYEAAYRVVNPRPGDMNQSLDSLLLLVLGGMRAQIDTLAVEVAALSAQKAGLVEALEVIAQGKSKDDIGCLADEWMLMAGRLVRIAKAALAAAAKEEE